MRDIGTKVNNTAPAPSGRLSAEEFNSIMVELEQAISSLGITLDTTSDTDTTMLAQAVARYASLGVWGTGGGSGNSQSITKSGSVVVPKALFEGMRANYTPASTNTGAATINVFGLGARAIRTWDDKALIGGEIVSGRPTALEYSPSFNSAAGAWFILPWAFALPSPLTIQATQSVTIPGGVTRAKIRAWGAGGGGGHAIAINGAIAQGGGGGEYREGIFDVVPGATYTATIGAGGAGAPSMSLPGSPGGDTSFGSLIVAKGGLGGPGAVGPGMTPLIANGGTGGSGGTFAVPGVAGETGVAIGDIGLSLGGGGSYASCGHAHFSAVGWPAPGPGAASSGPGGGASGGMFGGAGGTGGNGLMMIDWLP